MAERSEKQKQKDGDEVLRRMLKTPPKPHVEKPVTKIEKNGSGERYKDKRSD